MQIPNILTESTATKKVSNKGFFLHIIDKHETRFLPSCSIKKLKGLVVTRFLSTQFFLVLTNSSGPLIDMLKNVQIWIRFCGDIRIESLIILLRGTIDTAESTNFVKQPLSLEKKNPTKHYRKSFLTRGVNDTAWLDTAERKSIKSVTPRSFTVLYCVLYCIYT